jgi:hypothetical protein
MGANLLVTQQLYLLYPQISPSQRVMSSIQSALLLIGLTKIVDVPLTQEDQLEMLMEQFSLADLKSAYFVTMGKVGIEDPSEIILPTNACKDTVISSFISLIYDHRCMMYDYSENVFW